VAPQPPGPPLAAKLGVKEGHRLALIGAPAGWTVEGLPAGARVLRRPTPDLDVAVAFFRRLADLHHDVERLAGTITPAGALWLAWPRRAAGHESDITDESVRQAALPLGLVDVKVAALGQDWSGLKFVWRKELRAARRVPRT